MRKAHIKKPQLIAMIARHADLTKQEVERVLVAYSEITEEAISKQTEVPLPGVGRVVPHTSKARAVRNPQTGEMMDVPEKVTAKLKVTPSFLEAVN